MLRKKLWAEMLDLPAGLMAPLLTDPLASAAVCSTARRSWGTATPRSMRGLPISWSG